MLYTPLSNGKEATVNRALDGSMYPSLKLVQSVFGKINYGGLKHNSLYLGQAIWWMTEPHSSD
jgi:hypothetical protein